MELRLTTTLKSLFGYRMILLSFLEFKQQFHSTFFSAFLSQLSSLLSTKHGPLFSSFCTTVILIFSNSSLKSTRIKIWSFCQNLSSNIDDPLWLSHLHYTWITLWWSSSLNSWRLLDWSQKFHNQPQLSQTTTFVCRKIHTPLFVKGALSTHKKSFSLVALYANQLSSVLNSKNTKNRTPQSAQKSEPASLWLWLLP